MYTIVFDDAKRTLGLTLEGFWTEATFARFRAELATRVEAVRLHHREFAMLSDSTRFAVQSPDVAQGFQQIMGEGAKAHPGPTAIVVASMLNKLQVKRSMTLPQVAVFLHLEDARAWLAGQGY